MVHIKPFKNNFYLIFLFLTFLWFIFQTSFFAFKIKVGIPPDENGHLKLTQLYFKSPIFPLKDSINTYTLGPVSTVPYFYHLLMGKLLYLNFFNIKPYIFLRLINVLLSTIGLYFCYLLVKIFVSNKIIRLLILATQANILMYTFISGAISYDNLTNLLAFASTYFLFKLIQKPNRQNLIIFILISTIGCLTKITYLPLFLIQIIILLFNFKKVFSLPIFRKKLNFKELILLFLSFIFIYYNFSLYLGNLRRYGKINPSSEKVIGYNNSLKYYPEFQRNIKTLEIYKSEKLLPFPQFIKQYFDHTKARTFGILAHQNLLGINARCYNLIGKILLLLILVNIFLQRRKNPTFILIPLFLPYLLVIFLGNYIDYQHYRYFGLGLQGRYNFPILPSLIIFIIYNAFNPLSKKIKLLCGISLIIFLVYQNFFWFLFNATNNWYF